MDFMGAREYLLSEPSTTRRGREKNSIKEVEFVQSSYSLSGRRRLRVVQRRMLLNLITDTLLLFVSSKHFLIFYKDESYNNCRLRFFCSGRAKYIYFFPLLLYDGYLFFCGNFRSTWFNHF